MHHCQSGARLFRTLMHFLLNQKVEGLLRVYMEGDEGLESKYAIKCDRIGSIVFFSVLP